MDDQRRSHSSDKEYSTEEIPRANILGIGVSAITLQIALKVLESWVHTRKPHYVTVTPVHGLMEAYQDSELRRIFNSAGMVTPDGMPLVWLCRRLGFPWVERVYGPDLMLAVCQESQNQHYRHFLYGGLPGVAEKLSRRLQTRYPELEIVGLHSPPFREMTPEEDAEMISQINQSRADIVWVGISTPKQERWMSAHLGKITAPVMIGVGAAFDFHAGVKRQAPVWMQHSGLEWLFRLMSEPRRLWRRYLVSNSWFILLIIGQLIGFKKYSLE